MRIEKLSFDNINSLGGHFEVDLQHPSLTDAGIFTITGPTGVGKTTLLDAICYAIYGCTARQPKLTASGNEIMTHGARYCQAEAWVEKDGQRYIFTCRQKRRKTRTPGADPYTTPERSVSRIGADGQAELLANKVREVEQWAERLMKFTNFTRCMMLAQGEFARFLKDNAAGRSEALATITGTEIYQRIGEKVQERLSALREQIRQVALHEVMAEEERRKLEASLAAAEAGLGEARAALGGTDAALAWLKSVAEAAAATASCGAALQGAREAAAAFEAAGQGSRIAAAEKALQLQAAEQAAEQATRERNRVGQQLGQEEAWLAAHPGSAEKEEAEQAAAALAAQEPAINQQLAFLAGQVAPREEGIAQAAVRRQAAKREAAARHREAEAAQQAATRAEAAGQEARAEGEAAERARQQLAADAALAESLPAIRQRLGDWAACPQAESDLPEAEELSARLAAWQQEWDEVLAGQSRDSLPQQLALRESLLAAQARHDAAQQELAQAAREEAAARDTLAALPPVDEAQRALDEAQQRAELAYKIQDAGQKLAELYREFRAGKLPCCPCCGSPVPHERPVQADSVLDEARAQVKGAQQELRRRQQGQARAQAALAAAESAHAAARKNAAGVAQELAAALLPLGWESTPDSLAADSGKLRHRIAALAVLDARRAELDSLEQLAACRSALHNSLAPATAGKPATLAAARNLVAELDGRLHAWQAAEQRARQAAAALALAEEGRKHALAALGDRQEKLAAAQEAAQESRDAEQRLRRELAQLWQGPPAREAEESARRRLREMQESARAAGQRWQQLLREQEAHRALARAAQEQLPRLEAHREEAEQSFAEALRAQGFADRAACAAARMDAQQLERLRQQRDHLAQAVAAAEGARRQAAGQEAELRARALTDQSAESLAGTRAAQATLLHQQEELATTLRSQLAADLLNRRANAEKEAQIADVRAEHERWRRLYDILGNSRDGFKKYAQRITFNLLLVQANAQLRRLSERYALVQDAEEELGLRVLDRYHDDRKGRACSNLSGGESFIVSLALALGLSRMAGETRIDTLFLDEGFGTLDEDALEKVLDCLQGLRADGKLIGIISHVEALKERIPANIALEALGTSGRSTIAPHEAVVAQPGLEGVKGARPLAV